MRVLSLLVVALSLASAIRDARAGDRKVQERAAMKACLTGDANTGTEILADLYIESKDPVYIYNQGRCFEQSNRYDEAIARFREYLRKATTASEKEKADAEKHIADCEALLSRASAGEANVHPGAPMPPSAGAGEVQSLDASIQHAPSTEPGAAGSGLRTVGVVTAAAGGATLIAAVVLNFKANGMVEDLRHHYDKDEESSSKTYKTMSQVGYGLGATLVAGGAVLYFLGRTAGAKARITFVPSLSPGVAGATLEGAF
jgi:tetratricopeptide (TPR) repeat protein